jgi:hypothetical protein
MRVSTAFRNAANDAAVDLVNAGSGPGLLRLYSGARPAALADAPAGDLLAEFELADPAFGAAVAGVKTADTIATVAGLADGTIGFGRVLDSDETVVWDENSVGVTGSGEAIECNTLAVSIGVEVEITSWTVVVPAGS